MHHLLDDGHVFLLGLQDDQAALVLTSCTSADLCHHHKGVFVGTEVGIVQHRVGIDDTHHRHLVEVQSLGHHLRTYQDIRASGRKVADDALIGIARSGGVQVHTGNVGFRERLAHLFLYLLRTVAACSQVGTAATRTLCRHSVGIATVVARQLVQLAVVGQ